jgi:hypothetical protein
MALTYEWDEDKSRSNVRKHGVTFEEAKTIFNDRFGITIGDPDHSLSEERFVEIGMSAKGRILVVWYAERGENIRVIGCRKATPSERRKYCNASPEIRQLPGSIKTHRVLVEWRTEPWARVGGSSRRSRRRPSCGSI